MVELLLFDSSGIQPSRPNDWEHETRYYP